MTRPSAHRLSRRHAAAAIALLGAAAATGCAGPNLADHADERPAFDLRDYFTGTVIGHGLVTNRGGKVLRRFVVTIQCTWQGDEGTLDETFVFADGERSQRIWRLQRQANGTWRGRADDVVGVAEGRSSGPAFNWRYTLRMPVGDSVYEIDFDDWMYRIDERTVLNKATMSKFGVAVGEVMLSFTRA